MLQAGKYVVEVIVPPGFELVKEEDKNILLGDVYVAPVTQQFAGLGDIYIMPDQAEVAAFYNTQNPGSLNLTTNMGAQPRHEGDTGSIESFWPCVGAKRTVPDLNSLYPGAGQASPFAGAERNLCDRKEVTLEDQVLHLQFDAYRRPFHRHHDQRLCLGIRPVLAPIRREVRSAESAGGSA